MRGRPRGPNVTTLGLVGCVLFAAAHTFGVVARFGRGFSGFDVFAYTHPNFVYARGAVQAGYGLLWNDLQNCGQPFFAIISSALLNPVNALSLAFEPGAVLEIKLFLHLAIGGVGAYLLCRELGLGVLASLGGSLAFQAGAGCAVLARGPSFVLAAYAWLPAAAMLSERLLRAPRAGTGIALGIVLTLQLLAGFPQVSVFTYQWIGLRLLWQLVAQRAEPRARMLAVLGLALLLPVVLAAVQLFPAAEMARESVRAGPLSLPELQAGLGRRSLFETFRAQLGERIGGPANLLPTVGVALAGLALANRRTRRVAAFPALAAVAFGALAFSPTLFELYRTLPIVSSFRSQIRFIWVAGFAFGILIACGIDALSRAERERAAAAKAGGWMLAAVAALHVLSPTGLDGWEWWLLAATLGLVGFGLLQPHRSALAAGGLVAALAANLAVLATHRVDGWSNPGRRPAEAPVEDLAVHRARAWAFELVDERRSNQDRMYQVGRHFDYSVLPKSASIFRIPSIVDYEPQTSRRFAEYFTRMLLDAPMTSLNQFYHRFQPFPANPALFDLVAARFLVADMAAIPNPPPLPAGMRLLEERGTLGVYENPRALPRAFYVARAEVVPDPAQLLERLASPAHSPREVALVEAPPADAFLGGGSGRGDAQIEESRGEELVVRVRAAQPGFLFVSDQHYPGWEAEVDGARVPIQRANYAFRLVRVPAGESTVRFRYRPASLRIGAAISAISLLGLVGYGLFRARLRARRSGARAG